MTAFIATTRVDLRRTTTPDVDAWGEPVDADTTVATGLPAAISEDRQRSYLASGQREGVVDYYTIRLRPGVDVREGDRLVDAAGTTYEAQSVSTQPAVYGRSDVRVSAIRTGATSQAVNA